MERVGNALDAGTVIVAHLSRAALKRADLVAHVFDITARRKDGSRAGNDQRTDIHVLVRRFTGFNHRIDEIDIGEGISCFGLIER